jgi:hypothetical protein
MGTPRSSRRHARCVATASIYAGRRDPQWRVPAVTARKLKQLWERLERSMSGPPPAPSLGYRGSVLDCGVLGRWFAYGGVVESEDVYRRDPAREFERLLLESAPKDLIPLEILREFQR